MSSEKTAADATTPAAWMRAWHLAGEQPAKEKRENGRSAWPAKFKFLAVSPSRVLPDDAPLFTQAAIDAAVAEAYERCAALCESTYPEWNPEDGECRRPCFDTPADCAEAIRAAAPSPRPVGQKEK